MRLLIFVIFIYHQVGYATMDTTINIRSVSIHKGYYIFHNQKNYLQHKASYYIKNYGDGQLNTISYRGNTAQQNSIRWNGIDISSPFLGLNDITTIPFDFEESDQDFNIGKTYDVVSSLHFTKVENYINFSSMIRSNNLYQNRIQMQHRKKKQSFLLDYRNQTGKNNFNFVSMNNDVLSLSHNFFSQNSLLLKFSIDTSSQLYNNKNTFSFWYINTQREIPPTISSTISSQYQFDKSFRFSYENSFRFRKTSIAMLVDEIKYIDSSINLVSTNLNYSPRMNNEFHFWMFKKMFRLNIDTKYDVLKSSTFGSKNLFRNTINLSYLFPSNRFLQCKAGIIQNVFNNKIGYPLPTLKIWYEGVNKLRTLKLEISLEGKMVQRYPTANDLFWTPGGSPDLKPELSYQFNPDIKIEYKLMQFDINPFFYNTQNLIQWVPTSKGYWEVVNQNRVLSNGIFLRLKNRYKFIVLENQYQYISSTTEGLQLMYTPMHKLTNSLWIGNKKTALKLFSNYTSERFITKDQSQFIVPYHILDFMIDQSIDVKNHYFNLSLQVTNILNENYQEVANRAMPLRLFYFKLTYQFSK